MKNKETKTVIFSRPVKISDIDYEVQVPVGLTEEEEISWIMNNLDKVSQSSSNPEEYSLNNVDPQTWTEWSVEIHPALNYLEDEKISLTETEEYKLALEEFNQITDKATCIFIYNEGSSLSERIKVLDLEEGQIEEYKGNGKIIIACFNEEVKVKKTDWLKWAMEIASEWRLEEEVKSCYHRHIADGYSEEESANMALYDWDI